MPSENDIILFLKLNKHPISWNFSFSLHILLFPVSKNIQHLPRTNKPIKSPEDTNQPSVFSKWFRRINLKSSPCWTAVKAHFLARRSNINLMITKFITESFPASVDSNRPPKPTLITCNEFSMPPPLSFSRSYCLTS